MDRPMTRAVAAVSALFLGIALVSAGAFGQSAKDLVGTWAWVSIDGVRPDGTKFQPMGPNPKGFIVFDSNGRFAYVLTRSGLPKFAANNRNDGTPEENKAAVQGSLAYSGTYSVSDKTLILKIEASTYPNAEGTEQKRLISVSGDELKWTNPAITVGGTAETVLKRVK